MRSGRGFTLIEMLVDEEWKLPKNDRERLLAVFMYFGDPEDILPDEIPVIGYLDDVIEPNQTRQRLSRALEMLMDKEELRPARKHGNIPL